MAPIFEKAFGFKPEVRRNGSLDDLYNTMHKVRSMKPDVIWSWLPMFYAYYTLNGQTTLPQPLSNDRYSDMKFVTASDYFKAVENPDRLGTAYDETTERAINGGQ